MTTSPEDRQQAISVIRQALVSNGMPDDDETTATATDLVDQAIAERDGN